MHLCHTSDVLFGRPIFRGITPRFRHGKNSPFIPSLEKIQLTNALPSTGSIFQIHIVTTLKSVFSLNIAIDQSSQTKLCHMISAEEIQYLQRQIARFDDQQAYRLLFTALYPYLYPFARTLVKAKESAEEVVSDVFIKVWEKRQELEKIENLKVYLYVATRHIALNYLEKQRRNATDTLDHFQASELISVYIDPEQLLITADMMQLLRKAIDRLPPKCRIIFKLVKE